jgi:uncharacterized protein (DUF488 family)
MLQAHGVRKLIDIRTVPRSRTNPQFNRDALPGSLERAGIGYLDMPALGGLRRPKADSQNTVWRTASFRGYADYMQTGEFSAAIEELIELGRHNQIAIMCAEAVPWRCHRSLVADALTARGVSTEHIMSPTRRQPHTVTPFAKVTATSVTHPG